MSRLILLAVGVFAVWLIVGLSCAFAQVAPTPTVTSASDFVSLYVYPSLGAVVTALIAWGVAILRQRTSIILSQQAQNTIQSGAMTGISLGLHEAGVVGAEQLQKHQIPAVVQTAVQWLNSAGAPDAMKAIGVTPEDAENFVKAKLAQAMAAGNAPASAPIATPSTAPAPAGT